jgi:hypothetical protein
MLLKGAKRNSTPEQTALRKEIGCPGSSLWNLTHGLRDHHKLFYDSYFNSNALLEKLKTRNLYACGTIMSNRRIPKDFPANRDMQRGESITKHRNGVYVTKWLDKKAVFFASNYYLPDIGQVSRRNKDRTTTDINSPDCAIEYTKHMGGIDRSNRSVQVYSRKRWSKKHNWHRIFFHFLDLCVTNAFYLYKSHREALNQPYMALKFFKKVLADQLTKDQKLAEICRKQGRRAVQTFDFTHPTRYANIYHELGYEPDMNKRKRCWYCWNVRNRLQSRTSHSCKTCNVALCMSIHFLSYN